jgi:16S rRNA (cytidine1402-2'-O)-methyltransferase
VPGTLFVVGTPIGHLKDMTLRALEVLQSVDRIVCEDTRVTRKLTSKYGIQKPLESFFAGNEEHRVGAVVARLKGGEDVALVSDAGTPAISDPGYLLVRACREEGVPVVAVPGPSALAAALSVSGLPSDRVLFLGFPPRRKGERRRLLESLAADPSTLVFYESPRRVRTFLHEALSLLPGRECVACRELTKAFETVTPVRSPQEVEERGELVILFAPPEKRALPEASDREDSLESRYAQLLAEGVHPKEAMRRLARERGRSRRDVYRDIKGKGKIRDA